MAKTFFTSDLHLGHDKEFIYKPRGFNTVVEHDAAIIERWNNVVSAEDTVYILGDVIMGDQDAGIEKLKQLNGKKIIVFGNHDTTSKVAKYREIGITDIGYANMFKYKKIHFYLSHYPTITSNMEKSTNIHEHIINLFGHTHSPQKFYYEMPFMYNVSMDAHNCTPVEIEDIISDIRKQIEACQKIVDAINEIPN